ncbi:peptide chain release factor N(5)-glutamine methyltransferase [Phormidium tenue FACHB-886]|nr:peptide chain release factor N(5)-glutamine methyltransferase [Phormidium tenue FACHB-886]
MESVVSGMELWQWRREAQQQAIAANIAAAEIDWLLQAMGLDRLSLRLESFKTQPKISLRLPFTELKQLWQRRVEGRVPVQYLVGTAPWRNFLLQVSPAVLIPRPDTEELVDLAKQAAPPELQQGHWADLGTGSGAIALGLAESFPTATIHAVDRSSEALVVAWQNAQQAGLSDHIQFYQGSWFEPLAALQAALSGMVSNPPYIPTGLIADLQPEVRCHEPHLALDGGEDGLDCIRQLIRFAPLYLKSGGLWLIEMMEGQAAQVVQLLEAEGSYGQIQVHTDLSGVDRFVLAVRR